MSNDTYFDIRNLASPMGERGGCPVASCTAPLGTAVYRGREMPHCPEHRIRIHAGSRTFVYYHGRDAASKRDAALRNIVFERDYFGKHVLGNAAKAESGRIGHEASEDALTWNVFSRLASGGALASLLSSFTHQQPWNEPELYLWGLRVELGNPSPPALFPPLASARDVFESRIKKFRTEPDIMLYVPGQVLVLIEAKFTSGNTVASGCLADDVVDEKPKSREGILRRYPPAALPANALLEPPPEGAFYGQLYRNLVFAMHMANELNVRWGLVSLVCEGQLAQRRNKAEFQDPTQFIHACLPEGSREQFLSYSWERLYTDHVAGSTDLKDLGEYMYNKSANCAKALAL